MSYTLALDDKYNLRPVHAIVDIVHNGWFAGVRLLYAPRTMGYYHWLAQHEQTVPSILRADGGDRAYEPFHVMHTLLYPHSGRLNVLWVAPTTKFTKARRYSGWLSGCVNPPIGRSDEMDISMVNIVSEFAPAVLSVYPNLMPAPAPLTLVDKAMARTAALIEFHDAWADAKARHADLGGNP